MPLGKDICFRTLFLGKLWARKKKVVSEAAKYIRSLDLQFRWWASALPWGIDRRHRMRIADRKGRSGWKRMGDRVWQESNALGILNKERSPRETGRRASLQISAVSLAPKRMSTADTTAEVGAGSRQLSCTREASEKAMAPTPVLLPGKSHGWRSLVGCSPRGCWESDTTKWLPTFTFHFHALEKEMATHSSTRAWRIPGTGEPGGLPSMGSHRVGHDWSDLAAAAAAAAGKHSHDTDDSMGSIFSAVQ